jgi:RNA polymerase sigma-70 factor (ECF subfamily)
MDSVERDPGDTHLLLQRVRAGDRGAFEELFARHRDYLHRFAELRLDPRLRVRVDPSDVVQETYLEALRRFEAYLEGSAMPLRLWLRQIALDRALKARRRHLGTARRDAAREMRLPERSSLLLAQQLLASATSPSQRLDRQESAQQIHRAVAALPEADREIILLRNFEGLSNGEAGQLLGIDPATASKRHGRAILRLHKLLFEGGMTEAPQ